MLLNAETISKEKLQFAGLGTVKYDGKSIFAIIDGHTHKIVNLENKTKSNGNPYQLGNVVKTDGSNLVVATAMCETTKNGDPMIGFTFNDRELAAKLETKRAFCILFNRSSVPNEVQMEGTIVPSKEEDNNNNNNVNG